MIVARTMNPNEVAMREMKHVQKSFISRCPLSIAVTLQVKINNGEGEWKMIPGVMMPDQNVVFGHLEGLYCSEG